MIVKRLEYWYLPRSSRLFLAAVGFLCVFQLLRAMGMQSPVYGGDEYAYFIQGIFLPYHDALYFRDPLVQKITNPLYLWLIWASSKIVNDASLATRLISVFSYIALVSTAGWMVARRTGWCRATGLVLLLAVLPSSGYSVGVMPDVIFYCCATAAALCVFAYWHRPVAAGLLAGMFVALAFLTKPHATSIFMATFAWAVVMAVLAAIRRDRETIRAVTIAGLFIVGAWATLTLLSWPLTGRFTINPRYPVGIDYSHMLPGSGTGRSMIGTGLILAQQEPKRLVWYFLGNCLTALLVLWPFLAILILHVRREIIASGRWFSAQTLGGMWLIFVAGAGITMTAFYTFVVATSSPMEMGRLHGRYFAYVYAIVIVLAFLVPRWSELVAGRSRDLKLPYAWIIAFAWLVTNIAGIMYLMKYQVWFQDNSELFSLVETLLSLKGKQHAVINWIGLICFLAAPLALLLRRPAAWGVIIALHTIWFATALQKTTSIQGIHSAAIQFRIQTGTVVRNLLATTPDNKILFAGNSRYGQTAHVLYGAACLCHVRQTVGAEPIRAKDVPAEVTHVFAVDDPGLDFAAEKMLITPAGTLYRIIP